MFPEPNDKTFLNVMNVLHLYSGNMYGGVETLLTHLATQRHLCPQMQPEFALCFDGKLAENLRNTGVPLYLLKKAPRFRSPFSLLAARKELKILLEQKKYDVVICHSTWAQALFGAVIRDLKIPFINYIHDLPTGRHWLERLARRDPPDLAISNSLFTAAAVPQLYPRVPCQAVYNPLPFSSPQAGARLSLRQSFGVDADVPLIVQISRLERWKGHDLLLSALALLKEQTNWHCWIVGGAQRAHEVEYLQALKLRVGQLEMANRVHFLGQRYDIPNILAAADIFCQPNIHPEPFGIVFIEALSAGLPVVSTAMGGALEIVTPDCGRLTTPDDAQALAQSLQDLLMQPTLRRDLGVAAQARAAQLCDPTQQLNALHQVLQQTIKDLV
jgi:glycosyltransferase involved in cell wall biosynthesis